MSQNITWLGASYSNVPAVTLPKTGGGTARFTDATPTTAAESDVASGKIFVKADGSLATGTGSGGGGDTVFVVTLSWDSQENMYMPDCTYAQAYAAYQAGKTVAFECGEDDGYAPYYGVYSEDESCFYYGVLKSFDSSSPSYHWGYQTYGYFWTSEGVELDDNQIVYSMDGATATAAEIASGSYAFISSGLVAGTATRRDSTSLSASGATVSVPAGYYENAASKAVASGTAGTPTATKGAVSNHSVTVTPKVVNTAGYISGGTKTGTGVSVTAAELVSDRLPISANGTYDVTNYEEVLVSIQSSSMNVQVAAGVNRVNTTSYTSVSGQSLTVAKTGTYDVYWTGYRSSTSGTSGSQLYFGNTAYGSEQTTFSNHGQAVHLTGVSLTQGQTITVRAKARGTSYYMYVGNLTIVQTA